MVEAQEAIGKNILAVKAQMLNPHFLIIVGYFPVYTTQNPQKSAIIEFGSVRVIYIGLKHIIISTITLKSYFLSSVII